MPGWDHFPLLDAAGWEDAKVSGYVAAFSNQVHLSLLHLLAEHDIPGVDGCSKSRAAELLGLGHMLGGGLCFLL